MDKPYYLKQILKNLSIVLLATLIIALWYYLADISIIQFADSIKDTTIRDVSGIFILIVSIVLTISYVIAISISLYKIGLLIYELFMLTSTNDTTQATSYIVVNDGVEPFSLTSHLNKKISIDVKRKIVDFYNENKKDRNKGLLLACVIEYMCKKGWLNEMEPNYPKLEEFFKIDLQLEAVGFQQLDNSHNQLKAAISAVKKHREGEAVEPEEKDLTRVTQYEKFIKFMGDSN